ncbi:hypothetical protein AX23_10305 [Brucella melitensis 548]|nr:hypothetical protein AX23_10305 [Brucella melitensis 548]
MDGIFEKMRVFAIGLAGYLRKISISTRLFRTRPGERGAFDA